VGGGVGVCMCVYVCMCLCVYGIWYMVYGVPVGPPIRSSIDY
jgi:hypothetical protein